MHAPGACILHMYVHILLCCYGSYVSHSAVLQISTIHMSENIENSTQLLAQRFKTPAQLSNATEFVGLRGVVAHLHAIECKSMHSGELRVGEPGHAVKANIVFILSPFDRTRYAPSRRPVRGARRRSCATRGLNFKKLKLNCR